MSRQKTRVHPALLARADDLRADYHYHQPDSPHPTRHLLVEMSLRKGLRRLDALLASEQCPPEVPPTETLTAAWPRVRVDGRLLDFADRLRGRCYEVRKAAAIEQEPPQPWHAPTPPAAYPSRTGLVNVAFLLGLDEVARLYAQPARLPLHAS